MGIHKSLFNNPEHISCEFLCSLCTHILLQPYQVLCSQDHIFCKACLGGYIDECYQELQQGELQSQSASADYPATQPIEHLELISSDVTFDRMKKGTVGIQKNTQNNSIMVECPECKKTDKPSGPLHVNSFRPAKFVERAIKAQNIRCPTTKLRSCQWIGPMKDMKQHLAVCSFVVGLLCPHHPFGCTYRGSTADIITHMSSCPFSLNEISISSEDTTNSSSHITEPAAPLSPPQSSPIMEETIPAQYYYHQVLDQHSESRDYTNFVNDNGLQTPSMNSLAEDNSGDFSQPALEKVENVEHDTFIDHLDDLDMADMTLSPVNTPLPNYNTTIPTLRPIQVPPSPVTPIRRRRIIVEEESDQSQGDEAAERVVKDLGEITQQSIKQIPRGGNAQNTNKKSRILTDITMVVLPRGSGISSYSASHPIELNVNPMTSVQSQKDQLMPLSDFVPLTQTQQGIQQSLESQQQQQQQDQQVQKRQPQQKAQKQRLHQRKSFSKKSNLSIISQDVESLGLLQVRGPGRQETQRVNQMISQASSTGFVADVSSSISSIVSPLAGASSPAPTPNPVTVLESNVRGPKANTTNVFTMSQPVQFYVAESSSYLPLLVHAPRYLRSRRKRSRLGRSLIKRMTPIVHSVNMMKLSNSETPTPEITSPENSYLSHNAFKHR